jgi:hypothetical protein
MSDQSKEKWASALVLLAFLAPTTIWHGFVTVTLWRWLAVECWDATEIRIPHAIMAHLLVIHLRPDSNSESGGLEWAFGKIARAFTNGVFVLLIAFVARWFLNGGGQ